MNAGGIVPQCIVNTDVDEDVRRTHESPYLLMVDSLRTPGMLYTPEGEVFHANRYALEYLGVTFAELQAWQTNGLLHPDDRQAVVARFQTSIRTGESCEFECRFRHAAGVYQWFLI
ncbi:PAS domain-containing protein [Paraburkholderia sp. LEh10]|uniref:PAS domain-containing protein n=1 Tax=Paraburkholderia sp. LEh10 TaxID=2821353 RepID=UPI001AE7C5F3|nr:PAS domain-containing protein [Paraburkholderia sp. LEh10]MBP0595418.1 PAS domain-containing protein [Paraburkholderia sp. LEh10]